MLFFSLLAPFLWAVTNHLDKVFIDKYIKGRNIVVTIPFMCMISIFSIPILYFINTSVFELKITEILLVIFGGILYPLAVLPYMLALKKTDPSIIVPMF